ncbi:type VI secretion system baseplate subunit TssE [Bordetella avium]|uniref:type VI secretion system baseplate subunit TssE n=1 Tax=Bordetella avium TaxID=521 RepID=UPI000E68A075|nr:type VI secretion system baseplate subunit TssE [Bordetella avium]AZY47936.1 type VI secretion system baseplate subunit TssE [Bordetella avium]RIQ18670.1 type VI secretion system baseplate subunit TssE [Bordetella avium]
MTRYLLPLFDRLSVDAPETVDMAGLHESVALDLDRLLNTRTARSTDLWLDESELDYGVPDFSIQMLRSQGDRETIEVLVACAIRRFEPRLNDVQVKFSFPETDARRGHFLVSARLSAQPKAPQVMFKIGVDLLN